MEHPVTLKVLPPSPVLRVLSLLGESGFQAVLVGGCIRDSVRGITPPDWDIATCALPQETIKVLSPHMKVVTFGIRHGTVTGICEGMPVEVTTYRQDGDYTDSRRPSSVRLGVSLQDDLARRDFTVNAMAYSDTLGLFDPFNGMGDLSQRLLRAVGNPAERFSEDALRILRALRFCAQHGFSLDADTEMALRAHRESLREISAERVCAELCGILCGTHVAAVLRRYNDVLAVVLPELAAMVGFDQRNPYHLYDVFEHTVRVVENTPPQLILRLAALLHDTGKPKTFTIDDLGIGHFYGHPIQSKQIAKTVTQRLRLPRAVADKVVELVELHDRYIPLETRSVKRQLGKFGEETLRDLLKLKRADCIGQGTHPERLDELGKLSALIEEVVQSDACLTQKSLAINGRDIVALGVPQGPQIGLLLRELLEQVLDGTVKNEREPLLKACQRLLKDPRRILAPH